MQPAKLVLTRPSPFMQMACRGFAASEKQLKQRMKSVGSIGKITKAMKMVSAAKMKGDIDRLQRGREYGCNAIDMIFKSDQFMQRKMAAEPSEPATTFVPITSDKGLCGAVNSSCVREIKKIMAEVTNRSKHKIFSIGDKGTVGLTRPFPDILRTSITKVGTPYNYPTVMSMAVHVTALSADSDKICIIYNEFKSAINYSTRQLDIMPKNRFLEAMQFARLYNQTLPDKNTSNQALYELYLTSNLWVAFLNNAASEQSSRMTAMENASKNAKDIFEKLTLQYNKARQQRITIELCEIISGASAL